MWRSFFATWGGRCNVDIAVLLFYRLVKFRVVRGAAHTTIAHMPIDYVTFAKIEPAKQPVTLPCSSM